MSQPSAVFSHFQTVDAHGLPRNLSEKLEVARFSRGDILIQQGEYGQFGILLDSGVVKLRCHWGGRAAAMVALATPGECLGLGEVLAGQPASLTIEAVSRGRIRILDADQLHRAMRQDPAIALWTYERSVEASQRLLSALHSHADGTVTTRLARVLLRLGRQVGCADARGVLIPHKLPRQDLADMVGCRVETLVRILRKWRDAGWVDSPPGVTLILSDLEALRVEAKEPSKPQLKLATPGTH